MPCPGPFNFSHIADYIYDFCPLPDPDVVLSILVSDVKVKDRVCFAPVFITYNKLYM